MLSKQMLFLLYIINNHRSLLREREKNRDTDRERRGREGRGEEGGERGEEGEEEISKTLVELLPQ